MHKIPCLIGLTLLLACPAAAPAATYYVSPSGADANAGSQAQPWRTIQKAADTLSAGDTVIAQPGLYPEYVKINKHNGTPGAPITFVGGSSATNYGFSIYQGFITIDGFDIPGSLVLPGNTNIMQFGAAIWLNFTAHDIELVNNRIHDFAAARVLLSGAGDAGANGQYDPCGLAQVYTNLNRYFITLNASPTGNVAILCDPSGATNLYHSDHGGAGMHWDLDLGASPAPTNTVQNGCKIYGIESIFGSGSSNMVQNLLISNNVFQNTAYAPVSAAASNCVVCKNLFNWANSHDGIHVFGYNIDVRQNVFTNISDNALVSDHTDIIQSWGSTSSITTNGVTVYLPPYLPASNIVFEQNYVINSASQLTQIEADSSPDFTNWTFANNLFINLGDGASCDVGGIWFYNNTFVNCTRNNGMVLTFAPPGWARGASLRSGCLNNIFYMCGSDPTNNTYGWYDCPDALTDFTADYNFVCGAGYAPKRTDTVRSVFRFVESHGINGGDPQFVSCTGNDFALQGTSPLINAGLPIPFFNNDYLGNPRPSDYWDIGAFQHSSVPAPAHLRVIATGP